MQKPTWKQRLSYWFDHQLSRKPLLLIAWLGLAALLIVLLATFLMVALGVQPADSGPMEVFWDFLFQALTPNPFDPTAPLPFLIAILVITLFSLFLVSILIGLLTTSIEGRLQALRRGRSKVIENRHTLILGWSHQVFTIVSELAIAHENEKRPAAIVILAEQDKVDMEDAIRHRIPHLGKTRVICRSGSPMDLDDLEIVSPHAAGAIIVLPPDDGGRDSYVIKTILAIVNNPHRHPEPYHIVTQIEEANNQDVVAMVGSKDDIAALLTSKQIAQIIAQTSRQSGLSVVYTELLNFSGDEIYFQAEPRLAGKTYVEAQLAYEDSAVLGLRFANGQIQLNPPAGTRLAAGDEVIAVSRDDDTVVLSGLASIPLNLTAIAPPRPAPARAPEKGLILGWNNKAPVIVGELEKYVAPGSSLLIVSEVEVDAQSQAEFQAFQNQRVALRQGKTGDRQVLNTLDVCDYQHIIVLAYDNLDHQSADAETMVTLLHLRDLCEKQGKRVSIVSEMIDLRNRRLADVARIDDFIVSDHLISLMMAQLSQNNELYAVFSDLFDAAGSELYLKPVREYIDISQPVSFYTVVEAASRRGETAVGYRILREIGDPQQSYGIHTNPKKSELISFNPEDKVVVLAEN